MAEVFQEGYPYACSVLFRSRDLGWPFIRDLLRGCEPDLRLYFNVLVGALSAMCIYRPILLFCLLFMARWTCYTATATAYALMESLEAETSCLWILLLLLLLLF